MGPSINLSLPPGHHLITLTAKDAGGLFSTVTKEIEIIEEDIPVEVEEIPDEKENDEPILILLFLILLIASIIALSAFYMMMRWKRIDNLPEE